MLPTGRNLFTADPRTMPTPTAFDLGQAAADEVLRRYLQDHGDWPRSLVIDLWGSASLRTGGEEIAQGLSLMGCRPQWDAATGRVTGIEVLPPATVGRPRVDVTWRISGLFRDMFPTQIALIDAAARAVAARDEDASRKPAAQPRPAQTGTIPPRIFGSSPGTYGAGVEDLLVERRLAATATRLGRAYLDAASHAYGGAGGEGVAAPGAFAERIAGADLLVHTGDDPGRDILEGSADVAFIGGFSAAVALLGGKADVIVLDTTDPHAPAPALGRRGGDPRRARPRRQSALHRRPDAPRPARRLRIRRDGRPAGRLCRDHRRHPGRADRGACTTPISATTTVRAFLLRENPAAAKAIAERFASARAARPLAPAAQFASTTISPR